MCDGWGLRISALELIQNPSENHGMLKFGRFEISAHNLGYFLLDGGVMFGSVPKTIWEKRIASDEKNRIPLALRSFVISDGSSKVMVDAGIGSSCSEKMCSNYGVHPVSFEEAGICESEITDIVITHLHFDHAGGLSRFNPDTNGVELVFPSSRIFLHRENWELAFKPSAKERASYLLENIEVLKTARLELVEQSKEVFPDFWLHVTNGHSRGQLWVELRDKSRSFVIPGDMITDSHHLPLPFTTGLDMCAEELIRDKERLLEKAFARQWIIAFQHDMDIAAATVGKDERGHYCVRTQVEM